MKKRATCCVLRGAWQAWVKKNIEHRRSVTMWCEVIAHSALVLCQSQRSIDTGRELLGWSEHERRSRGAECAGASAAWRQCFQAGGPTSRHSAKQQSNTAWCLQMPGTAQPYQLARTSAGLFGVRWNIIEM